MGVGVTALRFSSPFVLDGVGDGLKSITIVVTLEDELAEGVGFRVFEAETLGVGVSERVADGEGVRVGDGVRLGVGVLVEVGDGVGDGVTHAPRSRNC